MCDFFFFSSRRRHTRCSRDWSSDVCSSDLSLTASAELAKSYPVRETRNGKLLTGIDVLEAERFAPLRGMRVGLITNHTGMDREGRRTIDLLYRAPGVRLAALFSPEHGLAGNAEDRVASATEPVFGTKQGCQPR